MDRCCRHSLLVLAAVVVVEKTYKKNKISLLRPLSFYYFKMSFCIGAVVHRGRGAICCKRDAAQEGLVNNGDKT